MVEHAPSCGHPLANAACAGRAEASGVWFEAARIDALILAGGQVLRTSAPHAIRFGVAQVRRAIASMPLDVLHLVFAPRADRPLLLGLARLRNRTPEPLLVHYSELWDVAGSEPRAGIGATLCDTPQGIRALADASAAIRGRTPEPPPPSGLALDLKLVIPGAQQRTLAFAYAAPEIGTDPAPLVAAWRGDVERELEATVAHWADELGSDALSHYRNRFGS